MSVDHVAPEATTAPTVERRRYDDDRVAVQVSRQGTGEVCRGLASSIAAVHLATAEFLAGERAEVDGEKYEPRHGSRRQASGPRDAAPVRTLFARLVGTKAGSNN
jgi:hypothetical protein